MDKTKNEANKKEPIMKQWTRAEFEKNIEEWTDDQMNECGLLMAILAMGKLFENWEDFYYSLKGECSYMRPAARVLWRTLDDCPQEPSPADIYYEEDDLIWEGQPVDIIGEDREVNMIPAEPTEREIEDEKYVQSVLEDILADGISE